MPLAGAFKKVLGNDGTLQVYAFPLMDDYATVADELQLYDMKGRGLKTPEALIQDVNNQTLFGEDGGMIDTIILATCEFE